MDYKEKGVRQILTYTVSSRQIEERITFGKDEPIVSHFKLIRKPEDGTLIIIYVKGGYYIWAYDVATQVHSLVAGMPDAILALHASWNTVRQADYNRHPKCLLANSPNTVTN